MKKYFSIAVLCALAVLGLGSCAKDVEEEIVTEQTGVRTVTFSASLADQTKTGLSMKFVPNWINTSLENVHLFETSGSTILEGVDVEMRIPADRNNEVAYFKADFAEEISIIVNPPSGQTGVKTRAGEEYTYTGIVAQKVDGKFTIPVTQTPDPVSLIDPNADFLIGDTKTNFSESMAQKEMDIYFHRPVSVSRLAIMNIAGEKVKTVKITSNDKLTASAAYSDVTFSTGEVNWDNSGSNVLTISYGEGKEIPGENTFYAYFISLPGNKSITSIEVTTDQYVYTKSYASGKTLKFDTVEFRNIAVDMSKVTPSSVNPDQPQEQNITFHKNNGTITSDSFTLGSGTYELPTLDGVAQGATVSWSLSESNPEGVATLNHVGNTWTLTPVNAGTVRVSVTATAVPGWEATTKSFVLTVSNAATQELSFTPESLTVTLGDDDFTEPVLSGAINAVTYSIDHANVATIDENTGKLTLQAAGTATVTATAAAGTSGGTYYAEATATYELTVNEPAPVVTTTYTLVNKQEDMVDGNYLIVAADDDKVFNGSGDYQGGYATISTTEAITLSGETITISGEKAAYEFAFAKSGNGYTITGAQGQIVAAAHTNASTTQETYITFASTGGSVFIPRGKLTTDDKALLFSTTRGTNTGEYLYFNTDNKIFKIGQSGSSRGVHLYLVGTRTAQTVEFADAYTYDLYNNIGWGGTAPTPSGDYHTELVYESSNTNVVYYDNGLKIAAGARKGDTATVTVTAPASAEYLSATATFTVTIADTTPISTVTVNLEPATELVAGDKYILVSNGKALVRDGDEAVAADFDATSVSVAVPTNLRNNLEWTLEEKTGSITRGNKYVFTEGEYFFGIAMNTNSSTYTYTVEVNEGRTVSNNVTIQDHNISLADNLIYYAGNSSNYYIFYNTTTNAWDNEKLGNSATPAATSKTALYKVRDERAEQNPQFTAAEAVYDVFSSTWTQAVPTLQNAEGTVTYESSNTSVVTVDANSGAVTVASTARKGDTAVITANAAGNDNYKPGTASYTVSIVNTNPNVSKYNKVTSVADLVAGAKYLIVFEGLAGDADDGDPKVFDPVLNSAGTQFDKATSSALDVTITNSTIESSDFDDCQFTLESGYYLKGDKANRYIYPGTTGSGYNSSNVLYAEATASHALTITFSEGIAQILNGSRYIVWSTSNHYFSSNSLTSSSATGICLYKLNDGTTPTTPAAQTLQFSAPTLSGVVGQSVTPPTLTGAVTTPVYSSSAPAVVAVDTSTGALTLLSAGTATITATAPAGTVSGVNYAEGFASYDVTVTAASGEEKYYVLVTSEPESWDGKYLIVNTASDGTGTALNGTGTASVTISGGKIRSTNTIDGYALTVTSAGEVHPNQTSSSQGLIAYDITFSDGEWLYWYSNKYKQTSENQSTRHNKCTLFYDNGGVRLMSAGYNVDLNGQSISTTPSKNYLRYSGGRYSMGSSYANERVQLYRLNGGGTTPDPGPGPEPPTPTTSTYTRISGSDALVTGTYLIAEKTDAYLYNASNVQNATHGGYSTITSTTGITREGTTITLTEDLVASHEFVFTVTGDNLTITPAGGENAGKYMYATNNVSNTYIDFQTSEKSFTIDPQEGNLVYFYTLKGSDHEYLYKKSTDSFFKLGGSGAPGKSDAGIYLYKKN